MPAADAVASNLARLKKYAEDVLQALGQEPPTDRESVLQLRQQAEKAARATRDKASGPVRTGIVGEFNAGKSMLLGSLLGFGDALPVSSIPSTGNITALRFVPVEDLRTTELPTYTIRFLDKARLHECLSELVNAALERARKAQVEPGRLTGLAERLGSGASAVDESLCAGLVAWSQETWSASQDPGLRRIIRELVWLARARAALPGLLDAQQTFDRDTAVKGLLLPGALDKIAEINFDALLKSFPALPRTPLLTAPDAWSEDLLQASFPLIRQVEIEVRLSRAVWDLSRLRGVNEFVLLDFPGLGAADSNVRDEFLCRAELAEVQTILILINSQRTGAGREAQTIFNMLQEKRQQDLRDFVLVGVSRFDDLPLLEEGREQRLDDLLTAGGEPADEGGWGGGDDRATLTEREVFDKLDVLQTVVANARSLTSHPSRIVFLSALLGLDGLPSGPTFQPGSTDFTAALARRLDRPRKLKEKWARLGALLDDGDPLAGWLRDFGRDGGLGRLRRLLEDHVADHGLRQLAFDAELEARKLQGLLVKLDQADAGPVATGPVAGGVQALNRALADLQGDYEKFKQQFDNPQTELYVEENNQPVLLAEWLHLEIRDELVSHFFRLPEWSSLTMHLRDGKVVVPEARTGGGGWGDADEEDLPAVTLPVSSDDFYKPFAETLGSLEETIRRRISEVIPRVLEAMSARVLPRRQVVLGVIGSEAEGTARVQTRPSKADLTLYRRLLLALDPRKVADEVLKRWNTAETQRLDPAERFPFPRSDGSVPGRLFPWSPEVARADRNHLVEILRYRNELVGAISYPLTQEASRLVKKLAGVIADFIQDVSLRLSQLAINPGLISCLAGEVPAGAAPRQRSRAASVTFPALS